MTPISIFAFPVPPAAMSGPSSYGGLHYADEKTDNLGYPQPATANYPGIHVNWVSTLSRQPQTSPSFSVTGATVRLRDYFACGCATDAVSVGRRRLGLRPNYTLRITETLRSSSLRAGDIVTVTVLSGTLEGATFSQEGLRRPAAGEQDVWLLAGGQNDEKFTLASARFGHLQRTRLQTLTARDGSPVTALRSGGGEVRASDRMQILADSIEQPRLPAAMRMSGERRCRIGSR